MEQGQQLRRELVVVALRTGGQAVEAVAVVLTRLLLLGLAVLAVTQERLRG